jgi:hypothetical protein
MPDPCQCLKSFAAVSPIHPGHCCFLPATQTCHPVEVAEWERQRDARRPHRDRVFLVADEDVTFPAAQSLDGYLAWLEETPLDQLPPGEDMSDLAALGEIRYVDVPAAGVAARVAVARRRGREWWRIAQYLGVDEETAKTLNPG